MIRQEVSDVSTVFQTNRIQCKELLHHLIRRQAAILHSRALLLFVFVPITSSPFLVKDLVMKLNLVVALDRTNKSRNLEFVVKISISLYIFVFFGA